MTATPLANSELLDPGIRQDVVAGPVKPLPVLADENRPLVASRGIAIAVVLAVPIWIIIGMTIYYLM